MKRLKLWFRNLALRQAIYFVDLLESLCYQWQVELRAKLNDGGENNRSKLPSPPSPMSYPVSDVTLAWRVLQFLFAGVGVVGVAAFFNTLRSFYLAGFTISCLTGYVVVFLAVRGIYRRAQDSPSLPKAGAGGNASQATNAETDDPATPARGVARLSRRRKLTARGFDARLSRRIAELIERE